eukprot:3630221-Prymnesium_polylepis.1
MATLRPATLSTFRRNCRPGGGGAPATARTSELGPRTAALRNDPNAKAKTASPSETESHYTYFGTRSRNSKHESRAWRLARTPLALLAWPCLLLFGFSRFVRAAAAGRSRGRGRLAASRDVPADTHMGKHVHVQTRSRNMPKR